MTTLVCVAHPKDDVLDAGGTIAKYINDGEKLVVVIFSYGEGADPLQDPRLLTITRIRESKKALETLGVRDTIFFSVSDIDFTQEIRQPSTAKKFIDVLSKYDPKKIFTHATDDLNPSHRAVADFVVNHARKLKNKPDIYEFGISIPFRIMHREKPRLYVDISKFFHKKKQALKMFKSQKEYISWFIWPFVWLHNWFAGFKSRTKYAEVFYKI